MAPPVLFNRMVKVTPEGQLPCVHYQIFLSPKELLKLHAARQVHSDILRKSLVDDEDGTRHVADYRTSSSMYLKKMGIP